YIIRADMLAPGSADVMARAAVPFERMPGEMVAAVAPQFTAPAVPGQSRDHADNQEQVAVAELDTRQGAPDAAGKADPGPATQAPVPGKELKPDTGSTAERAKGDGPASDPANDTDGEPASVDAQAQSAVDEAGDVPISKQEQATESAGEPEAPLAEAQMPLKAESDAAAEEAEDTLPA